MKGKRVTMALLLGSLALTGCHKGRGEEKRVVVEEKYVHKYGMELKPGEWQTRGQNGQVIATLDNGVVVTKQYAGGILDGETTYTYPHSSIVEHVDTFEAGTLVKTVYNDTAGHPKQEICYSDSDMRTVTGFYDSLAPRCKEIFRGERLMTGEYYTHDSKIESKIDSGSGVKILRDESGQLKGEALFESGKLARETLNYPNGNPHEIIPYKNDKVDGLKKTFTPSGEPLTLEEWSSGYQSGITTVFKNGEKYADIPYVKGRKEGIEIRYRDGTTIAEEITWEKDKMHGPYHTYLGSSKKTEWYVFGQRVSKATFEQQKN